MPRYHIVLCSKTA